MIALRLGVGVAAAIIVYFFFESGLVDGALFPDLQQIGFGRVAPIGDELAKLRAGSQALDASATELLAAIQGATAQIQSLTADGLGEKANLAQSVAHINPMAASSLTDKLGATSGELSMVSKQIAELQADTSAH